MERLRKRLEISRFMRHRLCFCFYSDVIAFHVTIEDEARPWSSLFMPYVLFKAMVSLLLDLCFPLASQLQFIAGAMSVSLACFIHRHLFCYTHPFTNVENCVMECEGAAFP